MVVSKNRFLLSIVGNVRSLGSHQVAAAILRDAAEHMVHHATVPAAIGNGADPRGCTDGRPAWTLVRGVKPAKNEFAAIARKHRL